MMFSRRDFIRNIALVAIGTAALPEQINALEAIFEVNTPKLPSGLIAIDEIYLGGFASRSSPTMFEFLKENNSILNLGMNLFGGVVRWVATPEGRIFTREQDFSLNIFAPRYVSDPSDSRKSIKLLEDDTIQPFYGSILYTDQNLKRVMRKFDAPFKSLDTIGGG